MCFIELQTCDLSEIGWRDVMFYNITNPRPLRGCFLNIPNLMNLFDPYAQSLNYLIVYTLICDKLHIAIG